MQIEIVKKKADYLVSKSLTSSLLLDPKEFKRLLSDLGDIFFFQTGNLLDSIEDYASKQFINDYSEYFEGLGSLLIKKIPTLLMTANPEAVYAIEARPGKFILYPRFPVVQVREHHFTLASDGEIHPMVFGKDALSFGLVFSYPQIFFDTKEKKIVEAYKQKDLPNTSLFKKIQIWAREHTKPARFIINGKKVNATFRIGKECSYQIQGREKELSSC